MGVRPARPRGGCAGRRLRDDSRPWTRGGRALVEHPDVAVVSFTGSCEVGRWIAETAGRRLAKTCLELGGKNPLIVCDDADLKNAVTWSIGSAFSNAGQRCAAGSRLIVFDGVYDRFKAMLVEAAGRLTVGTGDADDYGPVINQEQMTSMLAAVERAKTAGATVLTGGHRLTGTAYGDGYFVAPTILEHVGPNDEISRSELFGPITCLYRVKSFDEAIALANDSPFGLTASIHTQNINRAMTFLGRIQSGVAVVNGGTYGSEPHMPFGGLRQSGNGWREAGHPGARRLLRPEDDLHQPQSQKPFEGTAVSAVALIPARHGSKRVPGKNVRPLAGHPAIAYTLAAAIESGVFESVIVSTDSEDVAAIARHYGAEVPFLRPAAFAGDTSPDIEWVEYTLAELQRQGRRWDCFSLLRPTSPFRSADTIRRA